MSIQSEMAYLRQQHRNLTEDHVIAYARSPKTELHASFLWDDSDAAHRYRQMQARALIRIHIVMGPRASSARRVTVTSGKRVVKEAARLVAMPRCAADPCEEPSAYSSSDGFLMCQTPCYVVKIPWSVLQRFVREHFGTKK